MSSHIDDFPFSFKTTDLLIEQRNIHQVYRNLRPRTLEKTLNSDRYSKLIKQAYQDYSGSLDENLGDFLFNLDNVGDTFYSKFLNKNGFGPFCKFRISEFLHDKGIYFFIVADNIMYMGQSNQIMKICINQGYGQIQPKNSYKDGQSTNCRINSLINSIPSVQLGLIEMNNSPEQEIRELKKEIFSHHSFPWNVHKR